MDNNEYIIKHEQRKMEQDALITESKKRKFIYDIRTGLGEEMMKEPNKSQKKLNWWDKLKRMFNYE